MPADRYLAFTVIVEGLMNRFRISLLLIALMLAVVAAGCSKSTPATSGAEGANAAAPAQPPAAASAKTDEGLPHPCTLITQAVAEAVYGAGATIERDSVSACMIKSPSPRGGLLEVKIDELDTTTWDGGEMMAKFDKTVATVPGIGEGAYTYMGGSVVFRKGKAEVSVITSAYDGPMGKLDAAKFVAEKVAGAM